MPRTGPSALSGLRLAVGLLTAIRVRPPERIDPATARTAMLLAPVAVVPVAGLAAGLGWAGQAVGLPPTLAGVLVVAALAFGTRAMHADGLADTVDGLGSGKPAEQALEIMRRGDLGPMGTVALVLVLLAQALAAGAILARPWGWLELAVLLCAARGALALACLPTLPAARPDGLGSLVAGTVPAPAAVALWLLLAVACAGVGALAGQAWWLPLAGVAVALAAVWWLLARCVGRLGGITGDVLGATVELAAVSLLLVAAAG